MTTYFNRFTIEMTKAQALSASHQGQCDQGVYALVQHPKIARQLAKICPKDISEELKEYGAWDGDDLSNEGDNEQRIVWIAACNIKEDSHLK